MPHAETLQHDSPEREHACRSLYLALRVIADVAETDPGNVICALISVAVDYLKTAPTEQRMNYLDEITALMRGALRESLQ